MNNCSIDQVRLQLDYRPVYDPVELAEREFSTTAMRRALLTAAALIAFATNSILCRLALERGLIDPASFSSLRLLSGVVALIVITAMLKRGVWPPGGSWRSAFYLAVYVVAFSFAYSSLSTGTGALILFGAVQLTMMASAIRSGERPKPVNWAGMIVAFSGLVYLVSPGISAPTPAGALLMGSAGVAWGFYSLRGRGSQTPLTDTAGNFLRAVPFAIAANLITNSSVSISWPGALLAIASGALASGVGYVVWYRALRVLSTSQASTAQLLVPVLAALGGVLILSEVLTTRLVLSSLLILGGVLLGIRRAS